MIIFLLILPVTYLIFSYLTGLKGLQTGCLLSLTAYWVIILSVAFYSLSYTGINDLNRLHSFTKQIWGILAILPALVVFFIFFLPIFDKIKFNLLLMSIILGIINGICEELFWRGLTLKTTENYRKILSLVSVAGFVLWHITWLTIVGLKIPGGPFALLGGALFFGILWQFTASKTNNLVWVSYSHIIVSITSFTVILMANFS